MFSQLIIILLVSFTIQHSFKEDTKVKVLSVKNFSQVTGIGLNQIQTPSLGMFYAPWCGHCKKLIPILEKFAEEQEDQNIVFAVDCTEEKQICDQFDIKGYPTIKYFSTDYKVASYKQARSIEALTEFIQITHKQAEFSEIIYKPVQQIGNVENNEENKSTVEQYLLYLAPFAQKIIQMFGGQNYFLIAVGGFLVAFNIILMLLCGKKQSEVKKPNESKKQKQESRKAEHQKKVFQKKND